MKKKILIFYVMFILSFPPICFSEVKTYIKEYTYQASEDDSRNSSRVTAMREVKRLLLEELGTYLESVTEVQNFQLTKDQITALTAGIVKTEIVNEKWDGHTYWIKTKIVTDEGDVIKSIDNLRKDRDKSRELDELKKRSESILEENKKLREELKIAKGVEKEKQIRNYDKSIKYLSAIEWIELGIIHANRGDYNSAIKYYGKSIELNSDIAPAYNNRGVAYDKLGHHDKAILDYNKSIELNPNDPAFYYNRGVAYYDLGHHDKAISDCTKSIELNQNNTSAYNCRGVAYYKLGHYDKAILDYNKSIELNPNDVTSYHNRGAAYIVLGNHDKVILDFTKLIELDPKVAIYYITRGDTYYILGNYDKAILDYNKSIELNPSDAEYYYNRGAAYNKLGKRNEAILDFNKAIELNPILASPYYHRSRAFSIIGNKLSSLQDLEKAVHLNHDYRNKAKTEADFDNIRSTPEFKRLVGK